MLAPRSVEQHGIALTPAKPEDELLQAHERPLARRCTRGMLGVQEVNIGSLTPQPMEGSQSASVKKPVGGAGGLLPLASTKLLCDARPENPTEHLQKSLDEDPLGVRSSSHSVHHGSDPSGVAEDRHRRERKNRPQPQPPQYSITSEPCRQDLVERRKRRATVPPSSIVFTARASIASNAEHDDSEARVQLRQMKRLLNAARATESSLRDEIEILKVKLQIADIVNGRYQAKGHHDGIDAKERDKTVRNLQLALTQSNELLASEMEKAKAANKEVLRLKDKLDTITKQSDERVAALNRRLDELVMKNIAMR